MIKFCKAITPAGTRCKKTATTPDGFCSQHDPAQAARRVESARKAGQMCRVRVSERFQDLPDFELNDAADVRNLLSLVESGLLRGEVDPKIANSVAYVANVLLRAIDAGDTEERLKYLEGRIEELLTGRRAAGRRNAGSDDE